MASPRPSEWPDADRQMWDRLGSRASLLDDGGELAHLSPTTIGMLQHSYRQWIQWLANTEPDALLEPPEERASLERLHRWYGATAALRPMSRLVYIGGVLRVLRAARPQADWSGHVRVLSHLKRQAGSGDRSRKFGRVLDSRDLFDVGVQYATSPFKTRPTLLKTRPTLREEAHRFQTGTMIAMLAMIPLRSRTFRTLGLGSSVLVGEHTIELCIPGEMMKSGLPWEATVPDALLPLLKRYIGDVRPWFMKRKAKSHDFLWVTDQGDPFKNGYIGVRIALAVMEVTGTRVSPHLFRDSAATTAVRHSPESARLIRPLLAHSGFETAEKHYIHAWTVEAGRDYASLIRNIRKRQ